MTQAMTKQEIVPETIIEKVQNLTLEQQEDVLNYINFLQYKAQKQVNQHDQPQETQSFLEAAKEFIGCVESGRGDLSLKKQELKQGYKLVCLEES